MDKEKNRENVQIGIVAMLWIITISVILSSNVPILDTLNDKAVLIMLGFLFVGFIFFLLSYRRLFIHSFLCCAMLCLFLKSASNHNIKPPVKDETQSPFTVAHINLSSVEDDFASFSKTVRNVNPDIISLQEVTPYWIAFLQDSLSDLYPHKVMNVRIDMYGMAFLSKLPITVTDTISIYNIPILQAKTMLPDSSEVSLTNTLILPSANQSMDSIQQIQMVGLQDLVSQDSAHKIVMGDFNMVYWSNRIREFRQNANLENSRRDISQSVLSVPYDHIFFDKTLECLKFSDLVDSTGVRLGIIGSYQIKTSNGI